jgi:hypothetical protein
MSKREISKSGEALFALGQSKLKLSASKGGDSMGDVLPFGLMDDQIPKWHDEDYAARPANQNQSPNHETHPHHFLS